MRSIYLALSAIVAMAITVASATAKQPTIVYPTGIFPTDVQNVQAAIDQGGTVLLKATDSVGHPLSFNFGTPQHLPPLRAVLIQSDVSITGETVGSDRTTISGGSSPFRVGGGKNSIEGIEFDGPLKTAISIVASRGISVLGNEIQNVVPDPLVVGFTQADGIDVVGSNPTDISGNLVISGNTFGDLTGNFSIAIQVDSVVANLTISDNTFQLGQSPDDPGFIESAAIGCVRSHSVVTVSDNTIAVGSGFVGSGIAINGDADARYHISLNTINSQGPFTDGIEIIGVTGGTGPVVAALIEHNTITVHNSASIGTGIVLLGAVSQSTIQGNTVTGDAGGALVALSYFPGDQAVSNRFLFNDIASVTVPPGFPLVFFDTTTAKNILRGQCVSVVDLGIGNDVSCPNSHSSAALAGAMANRQQQIQRALQSQAAVHASITNLGSNP
jgi:hypothetical protein